MPVSDLPTKNGRHADYSMLLEMKRRQMVVQSKIATPDSNKKPTAPAAAGFENGVVDLYFTRGLRKNYAKF
jgi:hypothetical protein